MLETLRHCNAELLRDIEQLRALLEAESSSILQELKPFHDWVISECDSYRSRASENLRRLGLGQSGIMPDILSDTQNLTIDFRIFNVQLVSPILRARPADRLALKVLRWLHSSHPQTRHIPVAISDREFASWHPSDWPAVYYIPVAEQHRLLYLPICFHEFGHVLYECHRPEMDDLVENLQRKIDDMFELSTQRDDLLDSYEMRRRKRIVETWHEWAHELFCDAVGFTIGGPAFLYSFSTYFRMLGRDEYHLEASNLAYRTHPVTWMRVRILAARARNQGLNLEADALENAWADIAETMKISEEYYGFYVPEFLPDIQQTIDDMLTEAAPRGFDEVITSRPSAKTDILTPVELINEAWRSFLADAEQYSSWERDAAAKYISSGDA